MKIPSLSRFSFFICVLLIFFQSCKDDSYLLTPPPIADQSFVEEFDTLLNAYNKGWRFINHSEQIGMTNWEQGSISGDILAYSSRGTNNGFISSDYQATSADAATISNWAVSPTIILQNGDKIIFYTRCMLYAISLTDATDFANRLQVRINPYNDGLDVGNEKDPGDFKTVLLDINPSYEEYHTDPALYSPKAYPADWTRFEAKVYGLNNPVKGHFAFRYFVELGGSNGRGTEIGLDSVAYVSINH